MKKKHHWCNFATSLNVCGRAVAFQLLILLVPSQGDLAEGKDKVHAYMSCMPELCNFTASANYFMEFRGLYFV